MLSGNKLLLGILALAVAVGLAASAFAQGQTQKSGPQPLAVIDNLTAKLGDIIEGQDVEYTFMVKNKGDAELQIVSVRPG